MRLWEPILGEELAPKARTVLQAIERKVTMQLDANEHLGLYHGMAGQLLFLAEYGTASERLEAHVEKLISLVADRPDLNGGLFNGLSGIGLALVLLDKRLRILDGEFLDALAEFVRRFAKQDISQSNYDLLHGYLGECYFLLESGAAGGLNKDLYRSAIANLQAISVEDGSGLGWVNPIDKERFYPGSVYKADLVECCNLGMAHGSPGIILVLVEMMSLLADNELETLVGSALEFLFQRESEEDSIAHGFYYRGYSGKAGQKNRGPLLAWCYSDLGISMAYFKLWEITKDEMFFRRASRLARLSADRRDENTRVLCSGICHGAAGVAHMFNKIYQITKEERYKTAANYWFGVLFDKFLLNANPDRLIEVVNRRYDGFEYHSDNGIIEGLSGVGLALHSALSDTPPLWDKIFLI